MIVCFIGVDGSGKTTCAKALQEELARMGYDSEYLHYPYQLFRLVKKAFPGPLITSTHSAIGYPAGRISLREFPPIVLSFFEALTFRLTNRIRTSEFMIMDRYPYDLIVNYMTKIPHWPIRVYLKIVEQPTLTILLDIDAQTAHDRKPEADADYYESERSKYKVVCRLIGGAVLVINGELDRQAIVRTVLRSLRLEPKKIMLTMPSRNSQWPDSQTL